MSARRTARTGRGGFTLMELLLALLMTAILAGGLYQTLYAGRVAQTRTDRAARLSQIGRAVLAVVRRDLECLVQEPSPYNTGLYGQDGEGAAFPADTISFLTCSGMPLITSSLTVNYDAADRPVETDLAAVEYVLGTDDHAGLVRRSKRRLTCTLSDDAPAWREDALAYEVVGFDVRYWDGDAWTDAWDSVESESYPEAVEVTVVVGLVEKEGGEVLLYDEDGALVETAAFRTRVTLAMKPQNKNDAEGPAFGVVR